MALTKHRRELSAGLVVVKSSGLQIHVLALSGSSI